MEDWQNLTAGGVLALLIIREVLGFLKTKNASPPCAFCKECKLMAKQIQTLYDWHDVSDEDNVKVWYVRKSLERHIGELTQVVRNLNALLTQTLNKEKP